MPVFDRGCVVCAWRDLDVVEPSTWTAPACPVCGASTTRMWITKACAVIGDAIDHRQVNGILRDDPRRDADGTIHFTSRQDRARWMRAHDYRAFVRHQPKTEGKTTETTNWAAQYDPYTARNVRELLERAFQAGPVEVDDPIHVTPTVGELNSPEFEKWRHG